MKQLIDGVIETVITDEALHRVHKAAEPVIDEVVTPALSKSVQVAFLRAKKVSITQNAEGDYGLAEKKATILCECLVKGDWTLGA